MSTHGLVQHMCTETSQASPAVLIPRDADLNKDSSPLTALLWRGT